MPVAMAVAIRSLLVANRRLKLQCCRTILRMSSTKSPTCLKYSDTVFANPDHASLYTKFRPSLPQNVLDYVLDFLKQRIDSNKWQIAIDIGCGGGQSTQILAKHFRNVYGFDVSQAQIKEAVESDHPSNVHFEVSRAEKMPKVKTNSTQLVIAVAAAQWFNHKEFFVEVDRILVPNGVMALIGYTMFEPIDPNHPNDKVLLEMMMNVREDPIFSPYKLPNLLYVTNRYKDIVVPNQFEYHYVDDLVSRFEMSAQYILGFIETWSAYHEMFKSSPSQAKQYLSDFEQKLKNILKTNNLNEKKLIFQYRYYIVFGRKK